MPPKRLPLKNEQSISSKKAEFKEETLLDNCSQGQHHDEECSKSSVESCTCHNNTFSKMKENIEKLIDSFSELPCGPVYENMNKLMAEISLKASDEQSCVFHLTESHGAALRIQTCYRIASNIRKVKSTVPTCGLNKDCLAFRGPLQNGPGVLKRLVKFPAEWTIAQLTLEFDPLSRLGQNTNRPLGLYITRFSCGSISEKINDKGEGGLPFTVFIPPIAKGGENPTLVAAIKNIVNEINSQNHRGFKRDLHSDLSRNLEGIVHEMDMWLNAWRFILGGRLVDSELQQSIKLAVDGVIESYSIPTKTVSSDKVPGNACPSSQEHQGLSDRSRQILYLLASASSVTQSHIYHVVFSILKDKSFSRFLAKGISGIHYAFKTKLTTALRHPVILIIDDELDLIPFEMTLSLKGHPVTRIPSIHFLSALHERHQDRILKDGVKTENGFYILNPSKDLPSIEQCILPVLKKCVPSWTGIVGRKPSPVEFQSAIEENDVFLYCGHGGGNQFLPGDVIEKKNVKGVVILIGCSSSKLFELGGRVSMHSLFNSYLMSSCPSIVGNLWNVSDKDSNLITTALVRSWCTNTENNVDELTNNLATNLNIDPAESHLISSASTTGLSEVVAKSKLLNVRYYLNQAALVIRGLPVYRNVSA